jgi:hypothetical protein
MEIQLIQEGNKSDEGSRILNIQTVSSWDAACTAIVDSGTPRE